MSSKRQRCELTIATGGSYARLRMPTGNTPSADRSPRGKITGFSRPAARRLLHETQQVNRDLVAADRVGMLTLTYHLNVPGPREAKRHLDVFLKRLTRRYPTACGWWKLEPQKRGAPHFHLLLINGTAWDADAFASWAASAWNDVSNGTPQQLDWHLGKLRCRSHRSGRWDRSKIRACPHCCRPCFEQMRSWNGASSYASKYVAKPVAAAEEWDFPGRFWGRINADALPITLRSVPLSRWQATQLRRHHRRWLQHQQNGRHRVEWERSSGPNRIERIEHATPKFLAMLDGFDARVRPYHHRARQRFDVGLVTFMPAAAALRLLGHVLAQAEPSSWKPSGQRPPPGEVARRRLAPLNRRLHELPPPAWVRELLDHAAAMARPGDDMLDLLDLATPLHTGGRGSGPAAERWPSETPGTPRPAERSPRTRCAELF